ncbi:uncharacterized protein LOC116427459 isoform X2 [Nomia melanderi]|uniref:uncharacterized protein LOC116427459 isoform X2 n=1 Tax=Nomia melanderi TaxID=2448451 RepID=UPI003FCE4A77
MSGSGFRGRGFGPRGARSNGPPNGFSGPRFPHPNFNHSRPPHRLSGPDKWVDGPNFAPWQQNNKFIPRSQYRGNLSFRPNARGRAANGRGIVRFSGPGRPPGPQFCMGFTRNPGPRIPLPQEEQQIIQEEEKSMMIPQTPLLGSEEERQQKITETADKLKEKLSSITEEDLTNFWEDDLSFLPNSSSEEGITVKKGIPELRHEPPELDLTFTDFRDIGRVDCNNSKFDNIEDGEDDDDITIICENDSVHRTAATNNIIVINEDHENPLNISEILQNNDNLNQSSMLEDDKCQEQMFHEVPNSDLENLHLQNDNVSEGLQSCNLDTDANLNAGEVNDLINENALVFNNAETIPTSVSTSNGQDVLQVGFLENQSTLHDKNTIIAQNTNENDHLEVNVNQCSSTQVNVSQEEACQLTSSISNSTQNNSITHPSSNEEIQLNFAFDSKSPTCSPYDEVHKFNDDTKLCNPPIFHSRAFNTPPRFAPRVLPGLRCRWSFQQNGKNIFFRGPQRLPFHGNRMPLPRHIAPYKPPDMGPVTFGPCAPPPFTHNVPVSSHDSQHHTLVPFSSNDLLPAFDPSEPPPNIRSISVTESSNRQEITRTMSPLDSRNQITSVSQSSMDITQPPPSFDPRGPPPRISPIKANEKLPEFNPQQPPPKIHKQDELLQPPPIFDPRLSSQERSKLIAPLNTSESHMIANFSQPPPFMPSLPVNFQPVLPQTNNGQMMLQDFGLPPPSINMTEVPPPLPQEVPLEKNSNNQQGISMDDGLEDMQEAMEFAKQIMNMSVEPKNNRGASSALSEMQFTPSEIPIPKEDVSCALLVNQLLVNTGKKQKKKESKGKKGKQNTICEPEHIQKQERTQITNDEQSTQSQSKTSEDVLLTSDQIRPKVVFNLSSKTKVLQKPEEWHRPSMNTSEDKESSQQVTHQNSQKERRQAKMYSSDCKRNNQTKTPQREHNPKSSLIRCVEIAKAPVSEKSTDTSHCQDPNRSSEKSDIRSSPATLPNDIATQKNQKSKKENKKLGAPTSESSWKNRVISRFLKMSKNDICNMVNNSSLRKFDIAMKHLVKERRSSLSLKMRNTEDEKMKEYDREEFMNQLNAMLDPGAVVGITDLPTEFIHHLSEVLQLDPMPSDLESSDKQNTNIDEVRTISQSDNSEICTSEYFNEENMEIQPCSYQEHEDTCIEKVENKSSQTKEEPFHYSLNTQLSQDSSSRKSNVNKSNSETETVHKRQQPLFNEADLDDILSQVTERTKSLPNATSKTSIERDKTSMQPARETFEHNTFSQISHATVADLDDIFSAGIARAKSLNKNAELDTSRTRKSSSEDRNTFRSERYEKWSRKEREDPDSFRNLTKEEWEAKYGTMNASVTSATIWKTVSNSAENLTRDSKNYQSQRYCSSDSPMRNVSISPLTHESVSMHNQDRCITRCNEIEESKTIERSESSNDSSTTSSSDSDEETVAPNVTKLLKVIKEKEKIAKKRSLNETIRDEVAAEIEKKWKEKSKYKERKFRKREKRKKDKREKRKKEKKRKKKRNSHSNTSKSSELSEEFRLLTEDEIKKEVTVKEEPLSTFEDSISQGFNNEANSSQSDPTISNKIAVTRSWIELQNLQMEKQIPTVVCDKTSMQPKKKTAIISMTVQPKTKAQLKQMPESSESEQNQITEKSAEAGSGINESRVTNTDGEKMNEHMEESKDNEVTENNNDCVDTSICRSNSVLQTNVPLNVIEQSHTEVISNTNAPNTSGNCVHPTTETNANNQTSEQKTHVGGTSSTETKSGYRKIDIKAYKERALQRRLQEEAKLKEKYLNPISVSQDLSQSALPIDKIHSETEKLNLEKEVKATEVENDALLKDPRLIKERSIQSIDSSWLPSQKGVKEKIDFEEEHKKSKEPFVFTQLKNTNESVEIRDKEKTITQLDPSTNLLEEPIKSKDRKNDDKSSSQERITKREVENKIGSKGEGDEKRLKKLTTAEFNKFKNIRSEGSKELKLKKERKSMEKKSTKSKSSTREKDLKHSQKTEEIQKSVAINANDTYHTEIEKMNDNDTSELPQSGESPMPAENVTIETSSTFEMSKEQTNTNFRVGKGNEKPTDNNKEVTNVNNQQIVDSLNKNTIEVQSMEQGELKTEDTQCLLISKTEQNSTKNAENNSLKNSDVNAVQGESVMIETLNREEIVMEKMTAINNNSLASVGGEPTSNTILSIMDTDHHNQEPCPLDENDCLNNKDDSKDAVTDNNFTPQQNKSNNINKNIKDGFENEKNLEIGVENENQEKDESIAEIIEDVQTLRTCNKIEASEVRSPDSSGSPFKGFFVESIEDNNPQVSQLYGVQMENKDEIESVMETSKQIIEMNIRNKLHVKENDDKNHDNRFKKVKESDEPTLTYELVLEQPGITENSSVEKKINDNSNVTENNGALLKLENISVLEESQTKVMETHFSTAHDLVSQDTFDEDGEPFIVLDEYIDETEARSLGKLSNLELDLEDCIARDTDAFASKSKQDEKNSIDNLRSPNFNSIDFKELSEAFDKSDETFTETKAKTNSNTTSFKDKEKDTVKIIDVSFSLNESSNSESNVQSLQKSKLMVSIDSEVLEAYSQKDVSIDDIPRQSSTHESSTEMERSTHHFGSSLCLKISAKSDIPEKIALRKSLENLSLVNVPTSETSIELPVLNEEFSSSDKNNEKEQKAKIISMSSHTKISDNQDILFNITVEQEKIQKLHDIFETEHANRLSQEKENETLHRIKNTPKMKSKQRKKCNVSKNQIEEAIATDVAKTKYPTSKEAIMARMIEIDVEIHKLMTEKMTLYQMITNDALPTNNDLEQNNEGYTHKETDISLVRPRTPSALMSQLIQNIETSPVTNQCAKTTTENAKDSLMNPAQPNKFKMSRCEQHIQKRISSISTCSSENEESIHQVIDTNTSSPSKKKKKQRGPERVVKWENKSKCIKEILHINTEEKQANNIVKSIAKKVNAEQEGTKQDFDQALTNEIRSQENLNDILADALSNPKSSSPKDKLSTLNCKENEKLVEETEFQVSSNEVGKSITEQSNDKLLFSDADTANSTTKAHENRTPERSSIYSDDSTWDSFLQVHSDDQRKSTTGLALLEETYRKEMAKTRKIKTELRNKKKKEGMQELLQSVSPLTIEEEELPLSALYVKKLHLKKKISSVDKQEEKGNNDQRLWKNVDEVINAVAENRLEDLYIENSVEQLHKNNEINILHVGNTSMNEEQTSDLKSNSEPPKVLLEEAKEIVVSVPLKSIEEAYTQHSKNPTSSGEKIKANNYVELTSLNRTQALTNNEEQPQRNLINVQTQKIEAPLEISMTTEKNVVEFVQQSTENRNLEINQTVSIKSPTTCLVEPGANDAFDNQPTLNNIEVNVNIEKIEEENTDGKDKAFFLQEEIVDFNKTKHINSEEVATMSDTLERSDDDVTEPNNGIMVTISQTPPYVLNKSSNCELENMNEESSKDSSQNQETYYEKEYTADDLEGGSDPSKDEHFISLKDHKALKKRRESERSNKSSSEENNNRNRTPVPLLGETTDSFRRDEVSSKKLPKRKRGSSRTPLRRSSRYTEEVTKRIKLEVDTAVQLIEQESQEKNIQVQFSSMSPTSLSSYDEETENTSSNIRKSRSQKTAVNRKRCIPSEIEIQLNTSTSSNDLKDIKKCKQHTMPEMMNCKVRLVDSKHTILKPNVHPNVLRKYGISAINLFTQLPSDQVNHSCLTVESTLKNSLTCAKRATSTTESSQGHVSKLIRKTEDVTKSINYLDNFNKVRRGPKSMKMNLPVDDKDDDFTDESNIQVMQILTKEQDINISQAREKPDIEIVEEKMIVTKNQHQNDSASMLTVIETKDDKEIPRTQYTVHKGPILDIKVFENSFLAASEDGRIYRYSQASNGILNIYKGHKAAVTCLYVYNPNSTDVNKEWLFSGSLDGTLRCYNITTGLQLRDTADIGSPIQCMDEAWGIIFIGTKSGHVSRYHIKSGVIKGNSIQFSDKSVLALKATNEGPRRVLIVASRSQPITIRDAQNGLFLRTICGQKSHTVYSLMRDHNLIYCGTSTTSILVFDFTNGEQITQYDAGVGIVCMRLYKQLLFAGCYDGNIYIFDTKDYRLVCSIPGPGNMLLSMEIIDNKIIAGSKDKRLQSWQMSGQVRALL